MSGVCVRVFFFTLMTNAQEQIHVILLTTGSQSDQVSHKQGRSVVIVSGRDNQYSEYIAVEHETRNVGKQSGGGLRKAVQIGRTASFGSRFRTNPVTELFSRPSKPEGELARNEEGACLGCMLRAKQTRNDEHEVFFYRVFI